MTKEIAKIESIVVVHHNQPFTNTLMISTGVKLQHRVVLQLVRKHKLRFERFGFLTFRMLEKRGTQGAQTEYAELNEDQATFLMTLFRNSDVVLDFKERLVKEFRRAINEIARLSKQQAEPAWKIIRDETKIGFKWMNETLQENRAAIGKKTAGHHYSNEARMINAVLTNRFTGIDRNTLSVSDLQLMADLQRYNAILIGQDMPYQKRKAVLMDRATQKLTVSNAPLLE